MEAVLHQPVLVLNRLWQAVNICTAQRAFCLLLQGNATVVDNTGDDFQTYSCDQWFDASRDYDGQDVVRTVSLKIRIPRIILLGVFDKIPKKEVKFTRANIFERDKYQCQYCGNHFERKDLNLDHVIPRHQGGPTTWDNVVCSCIKCNTKKGNRTPRQANMHLIRTPVKPKWRPILSVNYAVKHDSWRHFLDPERWTVELG
ncbi:HNH endonuclease [Oscillatoria amoena NRMC-F 0135]|nr:HNH endonuclease [Oscillatoria amoena NRMC-F 0135]